MGTLKYITVCLLAFLVVIFLTGSTAHAVDGEVTYTGTNTNLTGDDIGAGPFQLGFTFDFYGTGFTSTYININGTINFSENYSRYNNVPLNTAKSGTNISDYSVYAFWDDLNTNASGQSGNKNIYYSTVGVAPNRMFVSQWTNIYFHGTTVQMGTFQIILYEGTNIVQIQYRDLLGNASQLNREKGNSATIGIRKNNSASIQYSHNTASITQEQAIRYTPNGSGGYTVDTDADYELVYLAPAGAPTSPTLVTPTDGTSGVTTAPTFEWLPVESATSYRILISTVSNFATTVADQTTASTSYTLGSSLSTSTQYYWRVQAINSNGSSLSPTRSFTTAAAANAAPNTPISLSSTSLLAGATSTSLTGVTLTATLSDDDASEQVRYRLQIASENTFSSLVIDYRSPFDDEGSFLYTFAESGGTYLVGSTATTLSPGNYYLRIRTEDDSAASSSWNTASGVAFVIGSAPTNTPTPTAAPTATATPTPTPTVAGSPSITGVGASVSGSSVVITWTTDQETSSQVEYGLIPAYGFSTSETDVTPRVTSHTTTISELKSCARYFYRVKSKNSGDILSVSDRNTFNTPGCITSDVITGSE